MRLRCRCRLEGARDVRPDVGRARDAASSSCRSDATGGAGLRQHRRAPTSPIPRTHSGHRAGIARLRRGELHPRALRARVLRAVQAGGRGATTCSGRHAGDARQDGREGRHRGRQAGDIQQCGDKHHAQGEVKITLTVDATGKVTDSTVASSPDAGARHVRREGARARDVREDADRRRLHVSVHVLVRGMQRQLSTRAEPTGYQETSLHAARDGVRRGARGAQRPRFSRHVVRHEPGRPRLPAVRPVGARRSRRPRSRARAGLPVVLMINGIHAGEVEGKEASMMLMRDLLDGKHGDLLARAHARRRAAVQPRRQRRGRSRRTASSTCRSSRARSARRSSARASTRRASTSTATTCGRRRARCACCSRRTSSRSGSPS